MRARMISDTSTSPRTTVFPHRSCTRNKAFLRPTRMRHIRRLSCRGLHSRAGSLGWLQEHPGPSPTASTKRSSTPRTGGRAKETERSPGLQPGPGRRAAASGPGPYLCRVPRSGRVGVIGTDAQVLFRLLRGQPRQGGLLGTVDFYVSSPNPPPGLMRHGVLARCLWPLWFAHDGVRLTDAHLRRLRDRLPQHSLLEGRGAIPYLPGLRVPYYVFVGKKQWASEVSPQAVANT